MVRDGFEILAKPNGLAESRLAVIVGRTFDRRSTRRNGFKRCVREVYRLRRNELKGLDILVRARAMKDQESIRQQMNEVFDRLSRTLASSGARKSDEQTAQRNLVIRGLLGLISAYRLLFSPLLGGRCRFYPSCSQYAMQAITEWGAVRGVLLASKRFFKCHPFHPGGYDPVPTALERCG